MKRIVFFLNCLLNISLIIAGFPGDALVTTTQGLIPLQSLKIGDTVICYKGNGLFSKKPIQSIHSRKINEIFKIITNRDDFFYASPDARFLLPQEKKWNYSGDLRAGNLLLQQNSERIEVKHVEKVTTPTTIFDIGVKKYHNFGIGQRGIIVHNMNYVVPIVEGLWALYETAQGLKALHDVLQHYNSVSNSTNTGNVSVVKPGQKPGGDRLCLCGHTCDVGCDCQCSCSCGTKNKNAEKTPLQRILDDAEFENKTDSGTNVFRKPNKNLEDAMRNFESLNPTDVKPIKDGNGLTGTLPDGTQATIRGSRDGRFTLDIYDPVRKRSIIKIRYGDKLEKIVEGFFRSRTNSGISNIPGGNSFSTTTNIPILGNPTNITDVVALTQPPSISLDALTQALETEEALLFQQALKAQLGNLGKKPETFDGGTNINEGVTTTDPGRIGKQPINGTVLSYNQPTSGDAPEKPKEQPLPEKPAPLEQPSQLNLQKNPSHEIEGLSQEDVNRLIDEHNSHGSGSSVGNGRSGKPKARTKLTGGGQTGSPTMPTNGLVFGTKVVEGNNLRGNVVLSNDSADGHDQKIATILTNALSSSLEEGGILNNMIINKLDSMINGPERERRAQELQDYCDKVLRDYQIKEFERLRCTRINTKYDKNGILIWKADDFIHGWRPENSPLNTYELQQLHYATMQEMKTPEMRNAYAEKMGINQYGNPIDKTIVQPCFYETMIRSGVNKIFDKIGTSVRRIAITKAKTPQEKLAMQKKWSCDSNGVIVPTPVEPEYYFNEKPNLDRRIGRVFSDDSDVVVKNPTSSKTDAGVAKDNKPVIKEIGSDHFAPVSSSDQSKQQSRLANLQNQIMGTQKSVDWSKRFDQMTPEEKKIVANEIINWARKDLQRTGFENNFETFKSMAGQALDTVNSIASAGLKCWDLYEKYNQYRELEKKWYTHCLKWDAKNPLNTTGQDDLNDIIKYNNIRLTETQRRLIGEQYDYAMLFLQVDPDSYKIVKDLHDFAQEDKKYRYVTGEFPEVSFDKEFKGLPDILELRKKIGFLRTNELPMSRDFIYRTKVQELPELMQYKKIVEQEYKNTGKYLNESHSKKLDTLLAANNIKVSPSIRLRLEKQCALNLKHNPAYFDGWILGLNADNQSCNTDPIRNMGDVWGSRRKRALDCVTSMKHITALPQEMIILLKEIQDIKKEIRRDIEKNAELFMQYKQNKGETYLSKNDYKKFNNILAAMHVGLTRWHSSTLEKQLALNFYVNSQYKDAFDHYDENIRFC